MCKQFMNKHAIITGGVSGIGRCVAETFLKAGAAVTVLDVDKKKGRLLRSKGLRFYCGDISDKIVLENFASFIDRPINFLINNACVSKRGILSGCSYENFEYVQRIGVTAPFYLTSLIVQKNLFAPNASIVNIASTRAFQSQPDTESYSAAKGGIIALTHALAVSLAGRVRVNSISPGWIETAAFTDRVSCVEHSEPDKRQHPAGRVGLPEDIAQAVMFLCSDKAGFITGENITIDGGISRMMIYHNDCGWKLE